MIALTSLLGSLAAWGAEAASRAAEDQDRKGADDRIAAVLAEADVRSRLLPEFFLYAEAKSAEYQVTELARELARLGGDSAGRADRDRLTAEAAARALARRERLAAIDPDALGPDGALDLRRKYETDLALERREADLDAAAELRAADASRRKSERLVGLTVVHNGAAQLLTLAQVARGAAALAWLAAGTVVLVAAATLLPIVQLAT
jgi:hypothetical protein